MSGGRIKARGSEDPLHLHLHRPQVDAHGLPLVAWSSRVPETLVSFVEYRAGRAGEGVHFFLDDYRFECVWRSPQRYLERLRGSVVLSPDFSVFCGMPRPVQSWQLYRSRWCASYWQSHGIDVIPTMQWAEPHTWDAAFAVRADVVAVSPTGAGPAFAAGYAAMLERVRPRLVLAYGWRRELPGDAEVRWYEPTALRALRARAGDSREVA
jgi:hypothetical protein